jgi:hypothetical protein
MEVSGKRNGLSALSAAKAPPAPTEEEGSLQYHYGCLKYITIVT